MIAQMIELLEFFTKFSEPIRPTLSSMLTHMFCDSFVSVFACRMDGNRGLK